MIFLLTFIWDCHNKFEICSLCLLCPVGKNDAPVLEGFDPVLIEFSFPLPVYLRYQKNRRIFCDLYYTIIMKIIEQGSLDTKISTSRSRSSVLV